jgi:AcrR family transcriptional regulator
MPARRRPRTPDPKPADRYHHGDLRRALLDAALLFVHEQGVEALSLRELARRLGVSHAAPAHHFRDRLGLLVAMAVDGFERLVAAIEAAARDLPPGIEQLAATGEAYVQFALDHPAHFQVMFGPEVGGMKVQPPELREPATRARRLLDEAIRALAGLPPSARGEPRDPFVEVHTFATWALLHGAARLWIDGPLRASMERRGAGRPRFEELARAAIALGTEAFARSAAGRARR